MLLQVPDDGFGNEGRDGVAVWVPPGTYRITKMLEIRQVRALLLGTHRLRHCWEAG